MALFNKIAVVTGAAIGIGKAITEILLKNGAKVALLDFNDSEGESLTQDLQSHYGQGRALFLSCNVESEEAFRASFQTTVDTFGGIDILSNNAGIMDEAAWEKTVSVNLLGTIRGSYLALEHMSKLSGGRGGVIVNTASMAGFSPLLGCPVYTATKHGVVGFTRGLANISSASDYGVRVNALCPGFVQTDLVHTFASNMGQFSHLAEGLQMKKEEIKMLTVDEVADSFLELVMDETKNGDALMIYSKGKQYVDFSSLA